ncbi:MAG: DUF6399 domain-containing protein [bacterium]
MDTTVNFSLVVCQEELQVSPRLVAAEAVEQYERFDSPGTSCSEIARRLDVADSTLRHWLRTRWRRMKHSQWPGDTVRFLESPEGLAVLHRMITAAHLIFGHANDCGIRNLRAFLELSGLDEFIASSYGAQQAVAQQMESLLIAFGEQEDQRLAAGMPPREISVAVDETFHPDICLVGMEPVSGFILLEEYQSQRDAETWNRCLGVKLAPLAITVCQVVSDQAKAIIHYAEVDLGGHHSPDLFHVQQDTSRGVSLPLASQTYHAEDRLTKTQEKVADLQAQSQACREECPNSSYGATLKQQLQQAQTEETAAKEYLSACQDRQQRARQARRGLSHDYHPFDVDNGRPLDVDDVGGQLAGRFDTLEQIAAEAGLSARATQKLAKARRVLEPMKATISFFWKMLGVWFSLWGFSESVRLWMRQEFIPGLYLARAAEKASDAAERHRLRELSQEILAHARSPDGLWGTLSPEVQADLERKAQTCADLFQRSSSCVEGRNGQLSLKHHALHRFTLRKLRALTVLHNYLVRRADGTTAAERFYGAAPRDLFAWLLDRLSVPARPRAHRRAA